MGIRLLAAADARPLTEAYQRNREHLAPWEPLHAEDFFTEAQQRDLIRAKREQNALGTEIPWVLVDVARNHGRAQRIIGTITLTGIVRGPFLSANLGYWVDAHYTGRGIGSAAVQFVTAHAEKVRGLHRIQAATLLHNVASRRVLARAGFSEIGIAPRYLKIAGAWQDHLLHQLILQET